MATKVATKAIAPKKVRAEYRRVSQCTIIEPGCMIHALIFMSDMLIPREFFISACRLRTWPKKATHIVT